MTPKDTRHLKVRWGLCMQLPLRSELNKLYSDPYSMHLFLWLNYLRNDPSKCGALMLLPMYRHSRSDALASADSDRTAARWLCNLQGNGILRMLSLSVLRLKTSFGTGH